MSDVVPYQLVPKNFDEAMNLARLIASSDFAPKDYKDKPGNVLIACQMGAELGLNPMQAIQNIAVVNSKPCLYGDAVLAIVQKSPNYVSHNEWLEGSIKDGNLTAFCAVTRKGQKEHVVLFSMDDAKKAGLWGKTGPWTQYPQRMLQMRARAFCLRDKFSDALRGFSVKEEVEDYHIIEKEKLRNRVSDRLIKSTEQVITVEDNFNDYLESIKSSNNMDELKDAYENAQKNVKRHTRFLEIIQAKDERKDYLMSLEKTTSETDNDKFNSKSIVDEFNAEIDAAEKKENNS